MNREAIWSAFWSMLTGAPGIASEFVTMSRLLAHHVDVPPEAMPALFLWTPTETHERKGQAMPDLRTLRGQIIFYIYQADITDSSKVTLCMNALDGIDAVFNTPPQVTQTLGGLVQHVYVPDGEVLNTVGLLQEVSIVTIPVTIVVP